jgi:Winged helix-turn-helix DNA-binding
MFALMCEGGEQQMVKPKRVSHVKRTRPLQDVVLYFIIAYKADPANDGNSPTYREIAQGVGRSSTAVWSACQRLQDRGLLEINARGKLTLLGGAYHAPSD